MAVDPHILRRLRFPARYEGLVAAVGSDVVRLLVPPADETLGVFRKVGVAVPSRAEGLFMPLWADSGTGKTTLASNLSSFLGELFAITALHAGDVTVDALEETVTQQVTLLPADDERVIPVLIDDRESNPATDVELAAVKQFLRRAGTGARSVILWPETVLATAEDMANRYAGVESPRVSCGRGG